MTEQCRLCSVSQPAARCEQTPAPGPQLRLPGLLQASTELPKSLLKKQRWPGCWMFAFLFYKHASPLSFQISPHCGHDRWISRQPLWNNLENWNHKLKSQHRKTERARVPADCKEAIHSDWFLKRKTNSYAFRWLLFSCLFLFLCLWSDTMETDIFPIVKDNMSFKLKWVEDLFWIKNRYVTFTNVLSFYFSP